MSARARSVVFLIIFVAVVWFVLDRVRVVMFVQMSPLGLLGLIVAVAVAIFLVVDHLIHRAR